MNSKLLLSSIIFGFFPATASAQTAECSNLIPPGGAFTVVNAGGGSHQTNSAKEWFCSSAFETSQTSDETKGSLSIPIQGIPVGANFDKNNQSHMQARQDFCSNNSKDFSSQQNNYLFVKTGDRTIVDGFLQCMGAQTTHFLESSYVSRTSGGFDVKVSSKPHRGNDAPIIVDTKVLAGAEPVDVDEFAPGTQIPFANSGKEPLIGTYAFKDSAPTADIKIKTTIGSMTITARKCYIGIAGSWAVYATSHKIVRTQPVSVSASYVIPQGNCHPHCKNSDPGTPLDFYLDAPESSTLSNGKAICHGVGCNFDPQDPVTYINPHRLHVHIQSRSAQSTMDMTADRVDSIDTTVREVATNGSMSFNQPFAVDIPASGDPELAVTTSQGSSNLTSTSLSARQIPVWMKASEPQNTGSGSTYTLTVTEPWCPAP